MTETATQSKEDISDLLAKMKEMALTGQAPEPGGLNVGDVISDGRSEEQPFEAVVSNRKSAGYVYVYDTQTGDQSRINRNMLPSQLSKRRADGSKAFDVVPPRDMQGNIITPPAGQFKCFLHKDSPHRTLFDSWRLPVCDRPGMPTEQDAVDHAEHRHRREWKIWQQHQAKLEKEAESERTRREREEDRERQLEIIKAAAQGGKKAG